MKNKFNKENQKEIYTSIVPQVNPEKNLRVLLLDDDCIFVNNFSKFAQKNGVSVSKTLNSEVFNAKQKYGKFDILVIDYHLDELKSGKEIAAELKNIPVILISNSESLQKNNETLPKNVCAFINKKIGVKQIIEQIKKISQINK